MKQRLRVAHLHSPRYGSGTGAERQGGHDAQEDHEGPITVHEHLLAVQIAEAVDTYEQSLRVPPPELPAVESSNPAAAPVVRRRRRRRAAGAAKPPGRPRKALAPPAG